MLSSPIEVLLSPDPGSCWSEIVAKQAETRRRVFQAITTSSDDLYNQLTKLLEDPDYSRFVLYCPFELLADATPEFRTTYMAAWRSLLTVHDVRANFVDGDVLETELSAGRDHSRVVKAAHLIPELLKIDWLQRSDIVDLVASPDPVLVQSIAEALNPRANLGNQKLTSKGKLSDKRKAWLKRRANPEVPVNPNSNLSGPFSENLRFFRSDLEQIERMIRSIEVNPTLSRMIYPLAIIYGSCLKGYGGADIDLAVLVQPNLSFNEHSALQVELAQTFAHEKIRGEVTQYWLTETSHGLAVNDLEKSNVFLGSSWDTHVLFGGAWIGDQTVIHDIWKHLLVPYMYNRDKRLLYLEELERDALLYRLLHRGYEQFHCLSDNKDTFFNSGYRHVATQLFASRVFLPKL